VSIQSNYRIWTETRQEEASCFLKSTRLLPLVRIQFTKRLAIRHFHRSSQCLARHLSARVPHAFLPSDAPENPLHQRSNPAAQDPRPERSVPPVKATARLTEANLRQLRDLKARDQEVRAHEQAHVASDGGLIRAVRATATNKVRMDAITQ
jgi:hypothetical protein